MQIIQSIQNRIYEIRGERVMLDFDLAALYEVLTKVLNQAVKRNIKRFPKDFMFRLTTEEWKTMRSQFVTINNSAGDLRSQIVTLYTGRGQHSKYLPYAFTEQGVAMLSGVLNSDRAINMNIAIMRAFVEIRRMALQRNDVRKQLEELNQRIGEHDVQISQIYDAIENMLDENATSKKWDDRERLGFKLK
ncbi:MAG: ORF6N domain-containing protein [Chitinophagaceae bacterium]|jgi:phage regulator Rha-like protein|nr:ORF6N domain-containing protein [Chitinophagaceae bacterium]